MFLSKAQRFFWLCCVYVHMLIECVRSVIDTDINTMHSAATDIGTCQNTKAGASLKSFEKFVFSGVPAVYQLVKGKVSRFHKLFEMDSLKLFRI